MPSLSTPKITLIGFNVPRDLRRRIYHAFNLGRIPSPKTVDGVVADPFRLLLLVIMTWYHWNNALFWALRNHLHGLEQINGIRGTGLLHSGPAEYAYMHLLAKDIIQTEELLHFALKMMGRLKALHEKSFGKELSGDTLDAFEQTGAALDYQCCRFEGLMERVQAFPKRMNNQISFVSVTKSQPNTLKSSFIPDISPRPTARSQDSTREQRLREDHLHSHTSLSSWHRNCGT